MPILMLKTKFALAFEDTKACFVLFFFHYILGSLQSLPYGQCSFFFNGIKSEADCLYSLNLKHPFKSQTQSFICVCLLMFLINLSDAGVWTLIHAYCKYIIPQMNYRWGLSFSLIHLLYLMWFAYFFFICYPASYWFLLDVVGCTWALYWSTKAANMGEGPHSLVHILSQIHSPKTVCNPWNSESVVEDKVNRILWKPWGLAMTHLECTTEVFYAIIEII